MLQISLLGPIEVRDGDTIVQLGGHKQRALLARLALAEGRPVAQSLLVEDLWGERVPSDPAHALQAHVSRLRAALPVPVERSHGGYRLPADSVDLDVSRFVELCERGHEHLAARQPEEAAADLRDALDLWRGPPLADLAELRELSPVVVRLEELSQTALTDRIDADLMRGRAAAVVPELQAILADSPLRERSWRQLMIALYRDGRESEALEVYQRARGEYVDQLGTEPGDKLVQLHQAILARTLPEVHEKEAAAHPDLGPLASDPASPGDPPQPAASRSGTASMPEMPARPRDAFSGRTAELEALERAWRRTGDSVTMAVVTGEPGIGKTRLATEFTARRAAEGVRVLFGRCDQSLVVPYQPFKEAIRTDLEQVPDGELLDRLGPRPGELIALLPELADRLPTDVPVPWRSDTGTELHGNFDAVAGWLAATTADSPVVVVIDDLQWADRQSVLLLRHLLHSPREINALLVTTFRDRERREPDPTASLLAELTRQSEKTVHVPLTGLDADAVSQLLSAELQVAPGRRQTEEMSGQITSATGGNPLFVVELARQFTELSPDRGAATMPGAEPAGEAPDGFSGALPAGLREVVSRRVENLPPETRDMLSLAAVIGKEFDPLVLRDAARLDDGTLDELLSAATYARLVEPVSAAARLRYSFCHDVVRTVLYEAIPPLRRGRIHRQVGEVLEKQDGEGPSSLHDELAHHYSRAAATGPVGPAVHYLLLAGRSALDQRAPSVALEHHRRARELLSPDAGDTVWCDLLTGLGTAEFRSGDSGFRETLLAAARLAIRAGDSRRLTEAVVANNRGWWSSTSDIDLERVAMIEAALESCDRDDLVARAQLLASWALENIRDPAQRERSVERSGTALALAEQVGDDDLLSLTLAHRYAVVYASFSDPKECVDLSERLLEIARRRGDPGLRLNAVIGLAQATMLIGEFGVSDRALAQAVQLGNVLDQPARLWMTRCWQAMRTAMRGDLAKAEEIAVAAFELGAETEQPDALTWFAGQVFTLRMLDDRLPELVDEIEEQVSSEAGGIPSWRAAWALTLTTVGRMEEAETILDEFVDRDFAQLPRDMLWLHGMAYLSGVCATLGRESSARSVYDALLPHTGLFAHNGTIDAGPVDLHLGTMARVIGERDLAEAHLLVAADLCRRSDAPLWLGRVRREQDLL